MYKKPRMAIRKNVNVILVFAILVLNRKKMRNIKLVWWRNKAYIVQIQYRLLLNLDVELPQRQ